MTAIIDDEDNDPDAGLGLQPPYRSYLVYCDETGMHGSRCYAFGSIWMPNQRRGQFARLVNDIRRRHPYGSEEIKWTKVNTAKLAMYMELVEMFFRHNWLMFHCLIVRKAEVDASLHDGDYELARQKHYTMLLTKKIRYFSAGATDKRYHVRVDALPFSYSKADEVMFKVANNQLRQALHTVPLASLHARDSKLTPAIGLADILLAAAASPWQKDAAGGPKQELVGHVAKHLGWPDMAADTLRDEWKYNIWFFHDPTRDGPRLVTSRVVYPLFRTPAWKPGGKARARTVGRRVPDVRA